MGMKTAPPFVGSDFSDDDYAALCEVLRLQRGQPLSGYKEECVKRRIAGRIRELGYSTPAPYIERLRHDPVECDALLEALSLHVSRFFRDPTTFAALRAHVVALAAGLPRPLRCWSAGCAGGEEPYSLAIVLDEVLGGERSFTIMASDVSADVLARARDGRFDGGRMADLPPEVLSRWFDPVNNGYALRPHRREMVDFFRHDLLAAAPYPPADLILCRYVLIYFSSEDQERVVRAFAAALPPGGVLVIGRGEVLRDPAGLFAPVDAAERIYRKVDRLS